MPYGLDNNYALLIGVGKCINPELSLPVTVKDVKALKAILVDPNLCGYIDDELHIRLLCNETATGKVILEGLIWLQEKANNDSEATVIIYYSGHGYRDQDNDYYLIPHDNDNLLAAKKFTQELVKIQAKQLLVIVDSCHAEGMAKGNEPNSLISINFPTENLIDNSQLKELKQGEGRAVFTSSKGSQLSWIHPKKQMSIYTYHLLEALQGMANKPGDDAVYVSDLISYVGRNVKKTALEFDKKQEPYFKLEGENFPVALLKKNKSIAAINNSTQEHFYIEPDITQSCYNEILQPGCLLRIKAPSKMGKSSLMFKIRNFSVQKDHKPVLLRLRWLPEKKDFENLEIFLKWFCSSVATQLNLQENVDQYWRQRLGNNKYKCQTFFEDFLLQDRTLALFIDDLDEVFTYENIAGEFLSLIRAWHEEAKTRDIWKQFRLIMAYTETYTKVNINESPLNIGKEINSNHLEFSEVQVQELAKKHQINLSIDQIQQLMKMVGGHPYLVQEAFNKLKQPDTNLETLLQNATTDTDDNIYRQYLARHRDKLHQHEELVALYKRIILSENPVNLYSGANLEYFKSIDKLENLGLVKSQRDGVVPHYELYRQYFRNYFGND